MVDYDISIGCNCHLFETWNDKPLNGTLTYLERHKIV